MLANMTHLYCKRSYESTFFFTLDTTSSVASTKLLNSDRPSKRVKTSFLLSPLDNGVFMETMFHLIYLFSKPQGKLVSFSFNNAENSISAILSKYFLSWQCELVLTFAFKILHSVFTFCICLFNALSITDSCLTLEQNHLKSSNMMFMWPTSSTNTTSLVQV